MADVFIGLLILLVVYLAGMVALVQWKGDTSIANFTWGGGVMLVAVYSFFIMSSFLIRQIVLTSMMVLWALRLIVLVYIRYTGKDPRFASWKWRGLQALIINICWVFGQISMIAIMSYPVLLVNRSAAPGFTFVDIIGLVLWCVGYVFESVSDYQLFVFTHIPTNQDKVMRYGLWRYSRHPNYFGEMVMWWSIFIIALSVPYGWSAIIAPITITLMLRYVTGIPWIEKAMANNAEYQEYQRKTNMLIPWFVQKY